MRDTDGLKNAFGRADTSFVHNVADTLADLRNMEEEKVVGRISLRAVFSFALICLLTGTALAMGASWGVLDFLGTRHENILILPEAATILENDPLQSGGRLASAEFTVREAVFDGRGIYLVVAVRPTETDYLLLGHDAAPNDPIGNLGSLFSDKKQSIAAYAKENGLRMLHADLRESGALRVSSWSGDFLLEEDGTLVYMLKCAYNSAEAELNLELICATAPYRSEAGQEVQDLAEWQEVLLGITLHNTGTLWEVGSTEAQIFADCGVRVDSLTLSGTPLAIYAQIEYTVIDAARYEALDDGFWFEFVDNDGERLPSGASGIGSITPMDQSGVRFTQLWSLQAAYKPPQEIVLRGCDRWENRAYEAHVFSLK